jgi:threonine aldolase
MEMMSQRVVELRSDTFTLPTDAMLRAMTSAELGDDVWDEDPTVHRLQDRAAEMVGKEAALFVPSGSMGNLCAVLSHTRPGEEVILEEASHIYNAEVASGAVIAGVQMRPLPSDDGRLSAAQVRAALREPDIHEPRSALLCLENTHNMKGGTCLSPEHTRALADAAHEAALVVHLDGARIFNAAIAQQVDARQLAAPVDSVMFCLSKGLSAPVGSMLAGSGPFIERARRFRKMLGGGMRQAGVLAAAGLIALEEMVDRLAEDHVNARRLAEGLARVDTLIVDPKRVETNMVFVRCRPPLTEEGFVDLCARHGVRVARAAPHGVRLVTHRGVSREDVDYALEVISRSFQEVRPGGRVAAR